MPVSKPILSIIVPSYNISKYVDQICSSFIDPILLQMIEVYFIDDGCNDDTLVKLSPYIEKYPLSFFAIHKENGGHGSVINYAVNNLVKTKYFKVIDGDDYIISSELICLCKRLKTETAQIILSDYSLVTAKKNIYIKCYNGLGKNNYSNYIFALHNITYNTCFYKAINLNLPEKIFYEDNIYKLIPLIKCKTLSYYPLNIYQYCVGDSQQSVSISSRIKRIDQIQFVLCELLKYFSNIDNESIKKVFSDNISGIYYDLIIVNLFIDASRKTRALNIKTIYGDSRNYTLIHDILKSRKLIKLMKLTNFYFVSVYRRLFLIKNKSS